MVNDFPVVSPMLRASDLIIAIPEFVGRDRGFVDGLWTGRLPFEVDPTSLYLIWHARHDRDPGVVWIREQLEHLIHERWEAIDSAIPDS